MAEKKARTKRNFGLLNDKGEEVGVFVGAQPRDAALKAANRGHAMIVLREKGTKKLHYFIGKRELVKVPENAPKWIKEASKKHEGKVFKAKVEKVGTAHLMYSELDRNDKALFKVPVKA